MFDGRVPVRDAIAQRQTMNHLVSNGLVRHRINSYNVHTSRYSQLESHSSTVVYGGLDISAVALQIRKSSKTTSTLPVYIVEIS